MNLSLRVAARFLKADQIGDPADLILRVATRFWERSADVIGDPTDLVQTFEAQIEHLAILEKDLPWMWEAQKALEDATKKPKAYPGQAPLDLIEMSGDVRLTKLVHEYGRYIIDYVVKVKHGYYDIADYRSGGSLFLAILQQYELPPKLRKSIEAGAKFFNKSRVLYPKKSQALAAYEKMMATLRSHLAAAKAALTQGKPRSQDAPSEAMKAGPFRLVNTGGFDDATVDEVRSVVEQAARLLAAKGLQRVLYGDVLISRTLSRQNVLAFYMVNKDELFVRANLRGKQHDSIRTVTHELGHRLHFKFLKDKDVDIKLIYAQLAKKSDPWSMKSKVQEALKDHPVVPGDTYVEKGATYEVTGTDWKPRAGLIVKLIKKEPALGLGDLPPSPTGLVPTYSIPLVSYFVAKGVLQQHDLSAFVTKYASKNHQENFAEMIAFWCQDRLPADQVAMLQSVL